MQSNPNEIDDLLKTAFREQGYLLAVLDIQDLLLRCKEQIWMTPQDLFTHLADHIAHGTETRRLSNFMPEREYNGDTLFL